MNLSQETIDKKFSLPKTTNKISTTRNTIGCLYQQTTNKIEFKELEIERFNTVVYTGSLQTQSYIQSSQKPLGNPLSNHTLIK